MKQNKKLTIPLVLLFIGIVGIIGILAYNKFFLLTQRQTMIHNKGQSVMPFDLSQTTHIFKKTDTGGIQEVISKDPNNTQQISLIRMHLQMETGLFQKGNFQDPMSLHGNTMPGVQELSNGASEIKFTYTELPNGAQIQYETTNQNLITAIHTWFDAQISDHGNDANSM